MEYISPEEVFTAAQSLLPFLPDPR